MNLFSLRKCLTSGAIIQAARGARGGAGGTRRTSIQSRKSERRRVDKETNDKGHHTLTAVTDTHPLSHYHTSVRG